MRSQEIARRLDRLWMAARPAKRLKERAWPGPRQDSVVWSMRDEVERESVSQLGNGYDEAKEETQLRDSPGADRYVGMATLDRAMEAMTNTYVDVLTGLACKCGPNGAGKGLGEEICSVNGLIAARSASRSRNSIRGDPVVEKLPMHKRSMETGMALYGKRENFPLCKLTVRWHWMWHPLPLPPSRACKLTVARSDRLQVVLHALHVCMERTRRLHVLPLELQLQQD
ncbi:hypothetical protein HJFPF1_08883 [Paramyrothecium foliicola]|nr:hypothetical protein HJFPF1_08883 [Paramyrothecium foliicola]